MELHKHCSYCQWPIPIDKDGVEEVPSNLEEWEEARVYHAHDCPYAATDGFTRQPSNQEVAERKKLRQYPQPKE